MLGYVGISYQSQKIQGNILNDSSRDGKQGERNIVNTHTQTHTLYEVNKYSLPKNESTNQVKQLEKIINYLLKPSWN